jgi:macrolide transport system ATP-binding/permease protein
VRGLRRLIVRLTAFGRARRDEERLRAEMEHHLALQTADNVRAGMPAVDARRRAILKFGPVEAVKERYRDEQRLPFLDHVAQDVRYAFRQLRSAPLFTMTAALSLALGVGANTAMFSIVHGVLLAPLPVANPHELVFVTDQRSAEETSPRFSYPFYLNLRENTVLNGTAARFSLGVSATVDGSTARVPGELVSGNYFAVMGAATQLGRPLTVDDDRAPGAHAVCVVSDAFWRRSLSADPSVVGRTIQINSSTFTIVGVAAQRFIGTDLGHPTDIWFPLTMQRELGRNFLTDSRTNWVEILGRLRSGATTERSGDELTAHLEQNTAARGRRLVLTPGGRGNLGVREELGSSLMVILALTILALVLASVNVASLIAVRSAARTREIAIRLALGARRGRLTQQFLTEAVVLAAIGGTGGLLIAPWAAALLVARQPHTLAIDTGLDLRMVLVAAAVTLVSWLLIGQAPILSSKRVGVTHALGSPGGAVRRITRRVTAHDVIVASQIALSLAMLISAALLVQSLRTLTGIDPGFRAENLLLVSIDPKSAGYEGARLSAFWHETLERVRRVHGVDTVSLGRIVPLGAGRQRQPIFDPTRGAFAELDTNHVGPSYFRTLGIPVIDGREFDEHDGPTSRPVVLVNERLARTFWPQQEAVGKMIRLGKSASAIAEVIGVVKDAKYRDLRAETGPMLYRSLFQSGTSDGMTLHARTASDPGAVSAAIRRELQGLDARVALFGVTTLDEQIGASFSNTRQAALLTGAFGLLALLLSGIGVYGVTALAVARHTRDIGIRMALGAQRGDIVRAFGRRGLTLVACGVLLGLFGSVWFTRIAETLLYGVTASDVPTFAAMAALMAAVSFVAIYLPIRFATRLDAVTAIRCE